MWKENWEETKKHFIDWWNHEGLVVGKWGILDAGRAVYEQVPAPVPPGDLETCACNAEYRAALNHYQLSRSLPVMDILPIAETTLGPGSLAAMLGSRPEFMPDTVWFHPAFENEAEPETLPPLRFDPANRWWQITAAYLRACVAKSAGRYLIPFPDLCCHLDVLSSLRGGETLCMDFIERPDWVAQKVGEILAAWHEAYERIYEIVKAPDGSAAYCAFYLWAPGRVAKIQCDSSAMFSGGMYRRFVLPALKQQCEWLDYALYHLDGTQAMHHLDDVLTIERLRAVEWTPQAGIEGGGNPRWFDLYRRIHAAGKSVQVTDVKPDEIAPLLDAIGTRGVYLRLAINTPAEAEQAARIVERYR